MTDDSDNIVTMPGWRQRLPDHCTHHLDPLKARCDELAEMMRGLKALQRQMGDAVFENAVAQPDPENYPGRQHDRDVWLAVDFITHALVLLQCSYEKLMRALPAEMQEGKQDAGGGI